MIGQLIHVQSKKDFKRKNPLWLQDWIPLSSNHCQLVRVDKSICHLLPCSAVPKLISIAPTGLQQLPACNRGSPQPTQNK